MRRPDRSSLKTPHGFLHKIVCLGFFLPCRQKRLPLLPMALALTGSGLAAAGPAQAAGTTTIGVRYERATNFVGGLEQVAVTGEFRLPIDWQPFCSFQTSYYIEAGAGAYLNGSPDARPFVEAGPSLYFTGHGGRGVYVSFGIVPTVIGGSDFRENRALGGSFFFTSHLGVGWIFPGWRIGLRYQHTSNANLSSPNPGVDMVGIAASVNL